MRAQRALVLDVDGAGRPSSTCAALRPILLADFRVDVWVRSKQRAVRDLADFEKALDERTNPGLIFLILSKGLFQEIRLLIESIKQKIGDTPIILVNESHEPNDLLQL